MAKIVMEIADTGYKPKTGDILVYNKEKDCFEIIAKESALNDIYGELQKANETINQMSLNIAKLAKIIKEKK